MSYNTSDNFNNSSSMGGGFGGDSYRGRENNNFQSQTSSYDNGRVEPFYAFIVHITNSSYTDNYSTGRSDFNNNMNSSSGMNDSYSNDNRERMGRNDFNSSSDSSFSSGGMTGESGFRGNSNSDNYRSSENDSFGSSGRRSGYDEDSTRSSGNASGMGSGYGSNSGREYGSSNVEERVKGKDFGASCAYHTESEFALFRWS
jgi:hypothetical protein